MNNRILNEIDQMKYLFGYKRGVVISEQKSLLTEALDPVKSGYQDALKYYSGGTVTGWTYDAGYTIIRDVTGNTYGSFDINKLPDDDDCYMTLLDNGKVERYYCKSASGKVVTKLFGTWTWDGSKPVYKFKGVNVTNPSIGYYQSGDTGYTETKTMGLGAQGPAVKKLQGWLVEKGYGTAVEVGGNAACTGQTAWASCDGIYGRKTKEAVKKVQKDYDISEDGIFGKETKNAINIDLNT